MKLTFFAPGIPGTKGSTRSFLSASTGKIVTTADCQRLKSWQGTVGIAARAAGARLLEGPVLLTALFLLPRPKGHFGKRGLLPSAPDWPGKKPDLDKLERAICDALTGVCYIDDAQVCHVTKTKAYATDECGVRITVEPMPAAASNQLALLPRGPLFERSA